MLRDLAGGCHRPPFALREELSLVRVLVPPARMAALPTHVAIHQDVAHVDLAARARGRAAPGVIPRLADLLALEVVPRADVVSFTQAQDYSAPGRGPGAEALGP